jgi:hypothetical protein
VEQFSELVQLSNSGESMRVLGAENLLVCEAYEAGRLNNLEYLFIYFFVYNELGIGITYYPNPSPLD